MKLFRYGVFLSFSTFVLLIVGGLVNPTGSSLACPDWPTCYGSFFPQMVNGVQFEHTHRIVATTVGLLTFILAFGIHRNRAYSQTLRRVSLLAALLVVFQGVLGGVTVIYKLPLFVSTGHLAIAFFFFSLTIYMSFRLYHERGAGLGEKKTQVAESVASKMSPLFLVSAIAVYLQIILGAFVRHTKSGRACGTDIPLCQGDAWPEVWPQKLHMMHRYFAIAVGVVVLFAAARAMRVAKERNNAVALFTARLAPTIVVLQILLGVVTVTTFVGLIPVTVHLAVGALLLASQVVTYLALLPKPNYLYQSDILEVPNRVKNSGDKKTETAAQGLS